MKRRNPTRKDVDIRVRVIKFTRNELQLLKHICDGAPRYCPDSTKDQTLDSLRAKVAELLKRSEYQTPSRKTQNQEPR